MSEQVKWQGRWLCPKCERIFKRPAQFIDGDGFHSWRCGNNPMRRVDVTITPAPDPRATARETTEAEETL